MSRVSKTVNPLHFEDLEPHRFEDLVRQLIYDFKDWKSIEATGRSGSDEGFDVRAWENIYAYQDLEEEDEEEKLTAKPEGRLWLIQCKREKSITPKKLKGYAKEINVTTDQPIYGVIFAAPCDFSKRSRDEFIQVIRQKGIQEFHLWGKAELEDMLFQPKNDHLLFAYFGFSIIIRRRSLKTQIRSKLSIKRKVIRHLGTIDAGNDNVVLIRDAQDTCYPYKDEVKDFDKNPRWWPYTFRGHYYNGIELLARKFFAYLADDEIHWDYVPDLNDAYSQDNPWEDDKQSKKDYEKRNRVWRYWLEIPKKNQAWFEIITLIPYERIIDIDKDGDRWFPHPHIYIECTPTGEFFEKEGQEILRGTMYGQRKEMYFPKLQDRVEYFPKRFSKPKKQLSQSKDPPE